jgi:hypothetical protein
MEQKQKNKKTVIYICPDFNEVWTNDLKKQEEILRTFAKEKNLVTNSILIDKKDNMDVKKRKNFKKLIYLILKEKIENIIVYRKTNISNSTYAIELFEFICENKNCKIIPYKE